MVVTDEYVASFVVLAGELERTAPGERTGHIELAARLCRRRALPPSDEFVSGMVMRRGEALEGWLSEEPPGLSVEKAEALVGDAFPEFPSLKLRIAGRAS